MPRGPALTILAPIKSWRRRQRRTRGEPSRREVEVRARYGEIRLECHGYLTADSRKRPVWQFDKVSVWRDGGRPLRARDLKIPLRAVRFAAMKELRAIRPNDPWVRLGNSPLKGGNSRESTGRN